MALVTSAFSSDLFRFLNPPAGYIAVDGTSLTVCEATDKDGGHCSVCAMPFVLLGPRVQVNRREKWFNLMLIAHTQKCIVIPKKKAADRSGWHCQMANLAICLWCACHATANDPCSGGRTCQPRGRLHGQGGLRHFDGTVTNWSIKAFLTSLTWKGRFACHFLSKNGIILCRLWPASMLRQRWETCGKSWRKSHNSCGWRRLDQLGVA